MTYYMEYQFAFKKHPNIGPTNGSLTPQDLSALVAYAKPLHLDVLGNQQSFGHFGAHPEPSRIRGLARDARRALAGARRDLPAPGRPLLRGVPAPALPVVQRLLRRDRRAGHRAVARNWRPASASAASMSGTSAASTTCSRQAPQADDDVGRHHPPAPRQPRGDSQGHDHAHLGLRCPGQLREPDRSRSPSRATSSSSAPA